MIIFSAIFLQGCASSATYRYGNAGAPIEKGFQVIDARAEQEKAAKTMSVNKSNCWFGVYRIGDDQVTPSKLELLSRFLGAKVGEELKGKRLTVKRFEVYNNLQREIKKPISMVTLGRARTIPTQQEIHKGGCGDAFSLESNPDNLPSILIHYQVDLEGREMKGKVVQIEPYARGDESVRSPTVKERLIKAISQASSKIAEDISP